MTTDSRSLYIDQVISDTALRIDAMLRAEAAAHVKAELCRKDCEQLDRCPEARGAIELLVRAGWREYQRWN